tara:strand:- start:7158 stop:7547 length:390 start_codon:yes stop_codon:yes gene_type:complete
MNSLLANIYGTGGVDLEKTAGVDNAPKSLSDLALMIAVEDHNGEDLEKVASVHDNVLENLISFDRAGRAIAHQEFFEMEKSASEGNMEPIETFFSDVVEDEDVDQGEELEDLRSAILEEIGRRRLSTDQ